VADSIALSASGIEVVLLDIEGTTTPITFVHDVLFPYARARVRAYLDDTARTDAEVRQIVEDLRLESSDGEWQRPPGSQPTASREPQAADIVPFIYWLMDRDRKSRPLKALQGRIWEHGYATGALEGEVYPDVRDAFVRWTAAGIRIGIFSSGSVLAQQLLFAHSTAGDLSPFLSSYFDTRVGAKVEADSYSRIAAELAVRPSSVLFVSDVAGELDAARDAGLLTRLCVRPPAQSPRASLHAIVESFDAIGA
jgi:enolase-phosphatase E1